MACFNLSSLFLYALPAGFFLSFCLHLSPLTFVWSFSCISSPHSSSLTLLLFLLVLTSHLLYTFVIFVLYFFFCSSFTFLLTLWLSFSLPLFDDLFSSSETHPTHIFHHNFFLLFSSPYLLSSYWSIKSVEASSPLAPLYAALTSWLVGCGSLKDRIEWHQGPVDLSLPHIHSQEILAQHTQRLFFTTPF